jgi:hypothetical protein
MKLNRIAASLAFLALSPTVFAADVIEDAMKKYHKGETSLVKKIGSGEASAAEIGDLLKAYEAMAKESPEKGTPSSWQEKTGAVITALAAMKGGNKAATGDFKKATNCKACHDVHREK